MHLGLANKLFRFYKVYKLTFLRICYYLFGFEYINCKLPYLDKRLIIPILKLFGANIGYNCDVESPLIINTKRNYKNLVIGDNVYLGKNTTLDIKGIIEIRDNVTISFDTTIISHIAVGKSLFKEKYKTEYKKTIIGSSCYIGANSTILMGVRLGENCFIAAGGVVTESFPSNSLIGGVPAKVIKKL